jgi:uncharacterized protein
VGNADSYLPRKAAGLVTEALTDTRVVVVNGARQTGKSTLAERVARTMPGAVFRFLDQGDTRAAAQEDPERFVRHDGLMLIDEVQRVPELWLAIKNLVDRDPRPGRFLLTGSARLLSLRSLPDALPGRSETIELWPLSQGEIDGTADGFVDAAFRSGADLQIEPPQLRRSDYLNRAKRGGYPEAVRRQTPRRRDRFFESYIADILSRDVKQVADIQRAEDMQRLLRWLAANITGILRFETIANALSLPASTVRDYIGILETIFITRRIPAWSPGASGRAVKAPKLIFPDSGLASHLLRGTPADACAGPLLENFTLSEIARQLTWCDTPARLYHYRDRDNYEVDAILEDNGGSIIGIEVKAAETVHGGDFRGLRRLKHAAGSRFRAGFVLYCGDQSLPFGDTLSCLPISAVWTAGAPAIP